jgi:hypothetical protein
VIDPEKLGTQGRRVRCSKCKHDWIACAPLITVADDTLPVTDKTPPTKINPVPPGSNLPAYPIELKKRATVNAIYAGVAAACLFFVPFYIYFNPPPANQAPLQAVKVEEKAKEKIEITLDGTPTTVLREEQGRMLLYINGAIVNKAGDAKDAPFLKAQALNAKKQVVKEWTIPLPSEKLEPGQRVSFAFNTPFSEQGVVDIAFILK